MEQTNESNAGRLRFILKKGANQEEMYQFFDSLEGVETEFMIGKWRGKEIRTGHMMEGLLKASNWYGKWFVNETEVHPLVFTGKKGTQYFGNPRRIMLGDLVYHTPRNLIRLVFPMCYPLIKTKTSKATLHMMEYRGKYSSCMIYDQLPIFDVFRKVDENTVLGLMDFKYDKSPKRYFFVLRRHSKR